MLDLNFIGLTKTTQDPDLFEFPLCQYTTLTRAEVAATLQPCTFAMGENFAAQWVLGNLDKIQGEVSKLWQDMFEAGLLDDWIGTCKEFGQHPLEALFFHLVLGEFYRDTWILKYSVVGLERFKKYLTQASVGINNWLGMVHRQNRNYSWRDLAYQKRMVTSKLFYRGYGHFHQPLKDNHRSMIKRHSKWAEKLCLEADQMLNLEYWNKVVNHHEETGETLEFEAVYGYSPSVERESVKGQQNHIAAKIVRTTSSLKKRADLLVGSITGEIEERLKQAFKGSRYDYIPLEGVGAYSRGQLIFSVN